MLGDLGIVLVWGALSGAPIGVGWSMIAQRNAGMAGLLGGTLLILVGALLLAAAPYWTVLLTAGIAGMSAHRLPRLLARG